MTILPATRPDLPAILSLQSLAYQSEAVLLQNFSIPPLRQTLAELEASLKAESSSKRLKTAKLSALCAQGKKTVPRTSEN